LAIERVKPSSARWATAWLGDPDCSGGVARTMTRPLEATLRIVGWKNS
jgi:hypothetical protein